jgi:hypothetical protein
MALSQASGYTLYNLIREKFDSLGDSISDQEEIERLITLAEEEKMMSLAEQMRNDNLIGKNNIPQPPLPTGCITKQEWLRKIAGA